MLNKMTLRLRHAFWPRRRTPTRRWRMQYLRGTTADQMREDIVRWREMLFWERDEQHKARLAVAIGVVRAWLWMLDAQDWRFRRHVA